MRYSEEQIQILEEVRRETAISDPVAQQCGYIHFTSYSKGKGRKRLHPVEIEMVSYSGKCIVIRDDRRRIDTIATEVMGESVYPGVDITEAFIQRLRSLG